MYQAKDIIVPTIRFIIVVSNREEVIIEPVSLLYNDTGADVKLTKDNCILINENTETTDIWLKTDFVLKKVYIK